MAGDYAFVAWTTSGLQVIDISDPSNPSSVESIATSASCYNVALEGDYAFAVVEDFGVDIINTAQIHSIMPGFSQRLVERIDTADFAEIMVSHFGSELISSQCLVCFYNLDFFRCKCER